MRHRAAPLAVRGIVGALRNRIPCPFECAAPRGVGAHLAARRVGTAVVADRRSGDDESVHDDRRRGDRIGGGLERRNAEAIPLRIQFTVAAKGRAALPVARIDREELRLGRGDEDAATARRVYRRRFIEPCGNAAAREIAVRHVATRSADRRPIARVRSRDRGRSRAPAASRRTSSHRRPARVASNAVGLVVLNCGSGLALSDRSRPPRGDSPSRV